jgi:hypothetical protein
MSDDKQESTFQPSSEVTGPKIIVLEIYSCSAVGTEATRKVTGYLLGTEKNGVSVRSFTVHIMRNALEEGMTGTDRVSTDSVTIDILTVVLTVTKLILCISYCLCGANDALNGSGGQPSSRLLDLSFQQDHSGRSQKLTYNFSSGRERV